MDGYRGANVVNSRVNKETTAVPIDGYRAASGDNLRVNRETAAARIGVYRAANAGSLRVNNHTAAVGAIAIFPAANAVRWPARIARTADDVAVTSRSETVADALPI